MLNSHDRGSNLERRNTRVTRNRKPVSCHPCRQRKLRCDRALPACGNCVHRGDIAICSYASRRPGTQRVNDASSSNPDSLQNKIDRLEQLILDFMSKNPRKDNHLPMTAPPSGAPIENRLLPTAESNSPILEHDETLPDNGLRCESWASSLMNPTEIMKINADYRHSSCLDEAHWALLLNEIGEVKGYLQAQQNQYKEQTQRITHLLRGQLDAPGPTLLFGTNKYSTRSEILSQMPSKHACDMMVTRYFSALDPALYILHCPTFQRHYEAHWKDRSKTSIAWIALLFAILRIAVMGWLREEDEPIEYRGKCEDLAMLFRNCFTECVLLADYTRPHDHLIEAMILHLFAEYFSSRDCRPTVWVLSGMIIRLAMRAGYHQGSQPLLKGGPFHSEMRRRSWAFLRQADILFSFQVGLPSMIKIQNVDENLPRNIRDDDDGDDGFHEDCKSLPAALPDSKPTQVSYLIAKTKLAFGFARALKEMSAGESISYGRVLEIDRELRIAYSEVPELYKLQNMSEQSEDSLQVILSRFTLANIHHKSLCVIHSRFLQASRTNTEFAYSRRTCLQSAMAILRFQAVQHQDIQAGGKMQSLTPYQTSLAIHDYLLAATILSAELCINHPKANDEARNQEGISSGPNWTDMITALDNSANIFSHMRDKSIEAYKASDVLGMLLKKLRASSSTQGRTSLSGRVSFSKTSDRPKVIPGNAELKEIQASACSDGNSISRVMPQMDGVPKQIPRDGQVRFITDLRPKGAQCQPICEDEAGRVSELPHAPTPTTARLFQPPSDYMPVWLDQRRLENTLATCHTGPASDNFPTLFDWSVPSVHGVENQPPTGWDDITGTVGARGTSTSLFNPRMLDLSDPVSTLWSLNSESDEF